MNGGAARTEAIDRETRMMAFAGVGARIVNAGLAFVTQVLFARVMGASEYGVFATASTLMLLTAGIAAMGLSAMPQRFLPEYEAAGDESRQRGLIRFASWGPFAIGAGFALAAGLAAWLATPIISAPVATAACLALLAVPAQAALDVVEGIALARAWKALAYGCAFVLRPLLVPLIFLLAWAGGAPPDSALAVIALAGATWIAAIALLLLARRRLGPSLIKGPGIEERRRWILAALPVMVSDAAFLLMASTDIVLLAIFRDDATVGAYGAAARLAGLVAFVHAGLTWASAHHFSALHASGAHAELAAYAAKTTRWTFWPSAAAAAAMALAAPYLLMLFGKGFESGAAVAAILLLGLLARAAAGPAEQLLVMTDNQEAAAYAYAWAFVVNVGLGAALIPTYGAIGAAAATAFAYAAASLIVVREVKLRLGFDAHVAALLRPGPGAVHA